MSQGKRKSGFDTALTAEQIEAGILRNPDGSVSDELEMDHGDPRLAKMAQPATGCPGLGQVLEQMGADESILNTDPKAYDRESTAPCQASPVLMTEQARGTIQAVGMIQAALETPQALNSAKISAVQRRELAAALADAQRDLPTPDAVAYVDNRRVILPAEVRDVPNKLPKNLSMKVLELLIGQEASFKVVKCARQAGVCFYQKPCLWLAQRLAAELSKRRIWANIEVTDDYMEEEDGDKDSQICKAVAQLFSYHVMEQMQMVCATRHISMHRCCQILCQRVCDAAIEEKAPKDYTEKYDNLDSLEAALGALKA